MPPKRSNAGLRKVTQAMAQATLSPSVPTRRRRRRRRPTTGSNTGVMRIRAEEIWNSNSSLENDTGLVKTLIFEPGASNLKYLDGLAKMFDRYKLHSAKICWKSSCSAVTSGTAIIGVVYDAANLPTTRQQAALCQPHIRVPVRNNGAFHIPPSKLMAQKELFCATKPASTTEPADQNKAAFAIVIATTFDNAAKAITLGEVCCQYDITLLGPMVPV